MLADFLILRTCICSLDRFRAAIKSLRKERHSILCISEPFRGDCFFSDSAASIEKHPAVQKTSRIHSSSFEDIDQRTHLFRHPFLLMRCQDISLDIRSSELFPLRGIDQHGITGCNPELKPHIGQPSGIFGHGNRTLLL
jgi:hypothetical protein